MTTTQQHLNELVLDVLPSQGGWSDEGYLWLTDQTNRLIEFTDGFIEELPMPTDEHQAILMRLLDRFRAAFEAQGGVVRFAPLRLQVRAGKFREPDLLVLVDANDPRRENRFWRGADLVAEIVSPDQPSRDLIDKRRDYAEAGVPEYWIVNPTDQTITVLQLAGSTYAERGVFHAGDRATSGLRAGLTIEVGAVLSSAN